MNRFRVLRVAQKGTSESVQYDFDRERQVSSTEVYFFDDHAKGGCNLPASWKLLYKSGNDWKPVEAAGRTRQEGRVQPSNLQTCKDDCIAARSEAEGRLLAVFSNGA